MPNFPPGSFRIDFSTVDFCFSKLNLRNQITSLLYFAACKRQLRAPLHCSGLTVLWCPRYLSQDEVLDQSNPFVQLVSGVVWLLRNGEVYVNQSLTAECDETQETGTEACSHVTGQLSLLLNASFFPAIAGVLRTFVDVSSARTAVGHDATGRLILFHIDGQTKERG